MNDNNLSRILDIENEYSTIDKSNILQNLLDFPDQLNTVFEEVKKLTIPSNYIQINKVLFIGVGGSAVGAEMTIGLVKENSHLPIELCRDYQIPNWVDKNTLVIGSSYSGGTEETVTAFENSAQKGAKIFGITSGGKIASICRKYKAPYYEINYGSEPRMALGYSLGAQIALLKKLKIYDIEDSEIEKSIKTLDKLIEKISSGVETNNNFAKQLANNIYGKIPVFVGSSTLSAVAKRAKQQINENTKSVALFEPLPEMNHNFVVGLQFPDNINEKIFIILLQSSYDHPRNKLRYQILQTIFDQKNIAYESVIIQPTVSRFSELISVVSYVDFVSYYLSLLYQVDPSLTETIEYIKEKLAKE
ncbi:MAG: Bifunctional phosphoglucose/phosphomannose isomerase [Berkelbacteria bacterium GW2011_GWA2_35_9]|uniref:Glutamine--fructose-6-phosphate aminotransferase [isomerizing] n=1 Tax=Berkelbacteria bacterium GW2011_GWA2_35_9 TaxID=1618333 RepID=A0A0G0GBX3_9BACT|nr:MAG: Bifunctional phosphoglucose/phosphomannose isomerase [Berkelbacteria bacterium GW2011_GWA2_35_9]